MFPLRKAERCLLEETLGFPNRCGISKEKAKWLRYALNREGLLRAVDDPAGESDERYRALLFIQGARVRANIQGKLENGLPYFRGVVINLAGPPAQH